MEIKVFVEGVQRVVCGVTEKTKCEEVVIALAKVLGRTGRYTLKEKFKEYERIVSPDECLLESLQKYGQQAREVQLTLHHLGPFPGSESLLVQAPLRRAVGAGRVQRGNANAAAYRQSLPPLSRLRPCAEPAPEEQRRPKRMSLTLLEEARGWLENLGRGGRKQLGRDKGKGKNDKGDTPAANMPAKASKTVPASGASMGKDKNGRIKTEGQSIISCLGGNKDQNERVARKEEERNQKTDLRLDAPCQARLKESQELALVPERAEVAEIRRLVIQQQVRMKELKFKIDECDEQIQRLEMEERQKKQAQEQSSESSSQLSEEEEQLKFWLNELKAEEGYESELQAQFFMLREKAAGCKKKLEEIKDALQETDLTSINFQCQQGTKSSEVSETSREQSGSEAPTEGQTPANGPNGDGQDKTVISRMETKLPCVLMSTNQLTDLELNRPSELRKLCIQWTKTQKCKKSSTVSTRV